MNMFKKRAKAIIINAIKTEFLVIHSNVLLASVGYICSLIFFSCLNDFVFNTLPLLLVNIPASTPLDMSILSLSYFLLGERALGSLKSIATVK